MVIHQPALTEPVEGQASDLAVHAGELVRVRALLEEILVRHTGRGREEVHADIERETVLDARQALEYGLVDRIVPGRRTPLASPGAR
ncbi:ATP-dependent Clp protease proteolytic subunit OS=Streptomyces tendae OX=1932 GN=clpP PE=3 SV=1 [Streptomyces tendae]